MNAIFILETKIIGLIKIRDTIIRIILSKYLRESFRGKIYFWSFDITCFDCGNSSVGGKESSSKNGERTFNPFSMRSSSIQFLKGKKKKRKDRFLSFSKNVLINIYRSRFQAQSSDNGTIKTLNRIQRKPRGLKEVWLANRVTVWSSIKRRIRDSCSSHVPVKMNSLGIKLCLSSFSFSNFSINHMYVQKVHGNIIFQIIDLVINFL